MSTIVHFEIPADDLARARHFYQSLFGWKFEQFGHMEYWNITTHGEHPLGGGLLKRRSPQHPVTNYVDVPSLDEGVKKVEQLGGRLIMAKTAVPGMGWFAVCTDTEGNAFGLWETDPRAG